MEENYKEVKSMQSVKKITAHGAVSIPVSIRRSLGLKKNEAMDIAVDDCGRIILTRHVPKCNACGSEKKVGTVNGITMCEECCRKILCDVKLNVLESTGASPSLVEFLKGGVKS
jgi:AbrB family looped-hinge helix DNA binding protein